MSMDNQTDYAAILADMEAKKLALGVAIASLRAALATGALGMPTEAPGVAQGAARPSGEPVPLPRGALLGKTGPEAIKLYLSSARKKQTNKEIGDALKQYGVESTSKNFDTFVNSALFRLKAAGEILRFDDGWGLAEWYPESFRARASEKIVNGEKKKAKKRTAKKTAKAKSTPPRASDKPKAVGLEQRIMDIFSDVDDEVISSASLGTGLHGVNQGAINLALGRLASKGKLEKASGGYKNIHQVPKAKAS